MQKPQKQGWIIQVYSLHLTDSVIIKQNYYRVLKKPQWKINEYFNPQTEMHFIEIAVPFAYSTIDLSFSALVKKYEKLGLKNQVPIKDFYSLQSENERFALFFDKTNAK